MATIDQAKSKYNYIPSLHAGNVTRLPMRKILEALEPYVLEMIPEGIQSDPDAMQDVDRLIGRLANLYTYLAFLFIVLSSKVSSMKAMGEEQVDIDLMIKRKEALQVLRDAVKEKHRACSRMITIYVEDGATPFDKVDFQTREEKASKNKDAERAWDGVRSRGKRKNKSG